MLGPSNAAVPNAAMGALTFRGGPVLQNVRVVTVYWGNNVQFSGSTGTQTLDAFYKAVIASSYYDWLKEYNTTSPVQKFGRGTFAGTYAYTAGATGTLTDASIQTALGKLIDNASVPAPDANTLYAIHFAPGISIKMSDGSASCSVFCAYHGSFSHGGKNIYYSINPDQGGSCAGGCGGDPTLFNNTTSVASHELVEATTDADVGQNNLAWYDDTNGEIGDICNASQCVPLKAGGTPTKTTCPGSYIVQNEWSNSKNACVAMDPTLVVNDFTIAATPTTTIDVPQGGTATVMVAMTKSVGTGETATLTATGPMGVTGTFAPASASTDAGKSTLTISATATTMLGMGKVTISAAATSATHTLDVQINVTSPPDMAMQPDLAQPAGGGGGTGGGGGDGNGGGTGTGGNGNGGGNGNNGGGGDSGCSIGGGSIAGSWAFAGLILLALAFRRRRA
jgi:MYXO-CTERM domain-containing protein